MKTLTVMAFVVCASLWAHATTINEVIANHIQAIGGEAAVRALNSLKVSGTVSVRGMETEFTQFFKAGDKMRMEMQIMGNSMVQAYDGTTAWAIQPWEGPDPVVMPEDQAATAKRQANFKGDFIDPDKYGISFELKGSVDIDETTAYAVEVTYSDGMKKTVYIDAITWLPIKAVSTMNMMGQEAQVEVTYDNYRDVSGVQLPTKIEFAVDGDVFTSMNWVNIEVNPTLNDALFAFPSGNGNK